MDTATNDLLKVSDQSRADSVVDTIIAWGAKLAPACIAIPMAIYGVQHFIYLQFVADFIPRWIPWRVFWAEFTGAALIAAATGILFRVRDRWAATLLGAMIFLWVVLLHTSRIAAQPREFGEWRGFFQALAMSGFVFVLAGSLAKANGHAGEASGRFAGGMDALTAWGAKFGPRFIAVAMMALGIEHFVFANVTAPQVPLWLPGNVPANYLLGVVLIVAGAGLLHPRTARSSATLLGVLLFASMLLVHLPVVLNAARFESDWCKTFVMGGGAFLLASQRPARA